jgi:hypothetical protein
MEKVCVEAITRVRRDGIVVPLVVIWDGVEYKIDKVLDACRACELKSNENGYRYLCMIGGRRMYLWLQDDKWLVEK